MYISSSLNLNALIAIIYHCLFLYRKWPYTVAENSRGMDGRDSVRKKLESCGLLFGKGHFIECSRKLRSIDVHSFSPLSLALEHNVSVCNIMLLLHGFKSTDISPSVQAINTKQDQWECNAKDITCSQSTGSGLLDAGKMVTTMLLNVTS